MKKFTMQEKEAKIRAEAERKVQRLYAKEARKEERKKLETEKKTIPVFYASDEKYLPYLAVSLQSLKAKASKNYRYAIYVLHTGVRNVYATRLQKYAGEDFSVTFVDVEEQLEEVKRSLQLRDYYTGATYYRIFIAGMFPQYDKALYLDGDTVLLDDVAKLYETHLGNAYVGAVTDGVVSSSRIFQKYTKEVLGISANRYFNAGVLVMNLKKFREEDFYGQFRNLLLEYKFSVAQDQDYLNVLCKDKVRYLNGRWNTMPIGGAKKRLPALVHYNLTAKPWRYASIPYAEYFWRTAEESEFADELRKEFGSYSKAERDKDAMSEQGLLDLASREIEREDNFIKTRRKMQNEAGVYVLTAKEIFEV